MQLRWKVGGEVVVGARPSSITRYGTPVYSAKNEIELIRLGIKPAGLGWYRLPVVKAAGLVHKRTRATWPWNPKCPKGEMVIGRTIKDVERVVNARTQRELGLALGYAPEQVEAFFMKKSLASTVTAVRNVKLRQKRPS